MAVSLTQTSGATAGEYRTGRVGLGDFGELFLGLFVSEGMKQSNPAFESSLRSRSARNRKGNLAELLGGVMMMIHLHLIVERDRRNDNQNRDAEQQAG